MKSRNGKQCRMITIQLTIFQQEVVVEWYMGLDIHQRIAMKECCEMLLGVSFVELRLMFSLKEIIEMFHTKLVLEGFEV